MDIVKKDSNVYFAGAMKYIDSCKQLSSGYEIAKTTNIIGPGKGLDNKPQSGDASLSQHFKSSRSNYGFAADTASARGD